MSTADKPAKPAGKTPRQSAAKATRKTSGLGKVPPFEHAFESIRYYIVANQLKPGDRLPSEREMSEMFNISRTALRSAVHHLKTMHVLDSQHGSGTYLAPHRPVSVSGSNEVSGFSDNVCRVGRTPSSEVVSQQLTTPDSHVCRKLNIQPEQPVLCLQRLRLIDGLPCMLETTYINREYFPGIETHDFARESLFSIMRGRYKRELAHGYDNLSISKADEHEAALLGIQEGTPVFFQTGVIAGTNNEPYEYYKSAIRPDRYAFVNVSGNASVVPELGW